VIVGNATRDITAHHKVSREKLSYILDSTAAPMATFGPVSDWIGYQVSLIAAAFVSINFVESSPYMAFLYSMPWNFYCLLALAAVPMIITGKDFGPMAKAELRAMKTGKLINDGDTPLSNVEADIGSPHAPEKARVFHFIIPLAVLIGVGLWGLWFTGGGPEGKSITDALADTDVSVALTWAAFAMTLVGIIMALQQKIPFEECENILLTGFRTMLPALLIMILAWSIGSVCKSLKTAEFVVSATESWMSPGLLPFLVFLVAMFISFATGTSWGTMAILTPIGIPLAHAVGDMSLVHITIGAIFSGAIFGDHCSPISDTTVMSSIFAQSDHIAHVKTQIPYALVPACISGLLYLLSSVVPWGLLLMAIGLVAQFFILRFLGTSYQKRNFSPEDLALWEDHNAAERSF
jgi:Na+/H+ antiporter NhaC